MDIDISYGAILHMDTDNSVNKLIDKIIDDIENAFILNDIEYINNFIFDSISYLKEYPKIGKKTYIRIATSILRITSRAKDKLSNWNELLKYTESVIDSDPHLNKKRLLRGLTHAS